MISLWPPARQPTRRGLPGAGRSAEGLFYALGRRRQPPWRNDAARPRQSPSYLLARDDVGPMGESARGLDRWTTAQFYLFSGAWGIRPGGRRRTHPAQARPAFRGSPRTATHLRAERSSSADHDLLAGMLTLSAPIEGDIPGRQQNPPALPGCSVRCPEGRPVPARCRRSREAAYIRPRAQQLARTVREALPSRGARLAGSVGRAGQAESGLSRSGKTLWDARSRAMPRGCRGRRTIDRQHGHRKDPTTFAPRAPRHGVSPSRSRSITGDSPLGLH
jgi:hypothetical protein